MKLVLYVVYPWNAQHVTVWTCWRNKTGSTVFWTEHVTETGPVDGVWCSACMHAADIVSLLACEFVNWTFLMWFYLEMEQNLPDRIGTTYDTTALLTWGPAGGPIVTAQTQTCFEVSYWDILAFNKLIFFSQQLMKKLLTDFSHLWSFWSFAMRFIIHINKTSEKQKAATHSAVA